MATEPQIYTLVPLYLCNFALLYLHPCYTLVPLNDPSCLKADPSRLKAENKPNLLEAQMNANKVLTKNYEEYRPPTPPKTNPIQTQYKPNSNPDPYYLKVAKMNVTNVLTTGYENIRLFRRAENKPNSNPIGWGNYGFSHNALKYFLRGLIRYLFGHLPSSVNSPSIHSEGVDTSTSNVPSSLSPNSLSEPANTTNASGVKSSLSNCSSRTKTGGMFRLPDQRYKVNLRLLSCAPAIIK